MSNDTSNQPTEIPIEIRSKTPPYNTWSAVGYAPFTVFGEQFAVTLIPCALDDVEQFRATHVATGVAVPGTGCEEIEQVEAKTRAILETVGEEKLRAGLAQARSLFEKK